MAQKIRNRLKIHLLVGIGMFLNAANLLAASPTSLKTAATVDELLRAEVFSTAKSPGVLAPPVDDQTFLRRASLDLIGRRPTPKELTSFADDKDPDKRNQMVARLMDDLSYGRNWGRYWRDVILYRRTDQRVRVTAKELGDFVMRKLNSNAPWDQVAREFITATGNVRENGNTALIMAQSGEPEETVAEISRIFMGIQIQCAQCHDHPYDRWTRRQFHELAAFFSTRSDPP